jgi:hypothetical protein
VISYLHDGVLQFLLRMTPKALSSLLRHVTDEIHRQHPDRFSRLLRSGSVHCLLTDSHHYHDAPDGVSISGWIRTILDDQDAHRNVGHADSGRRSADGTGRAR